MNNYNPNDNNIVVALDIGTTKVCAIAGRYNEHRRIEILAVGRVDSEGVSRGVISNIEKTVQAIHGAISLVERQLGTKVNKVHVGIAGQHIRSMQHRGQFFRDNAVDEISVKDIQRLVTDMHKLVLAPGETILHVIPQEYTVDNEQGIMDPIGMSGIRLEADFHVITGQVTASNNINRCVEKNNLRVAELTLEPIASSQAVLLETEKEAGVALVDIGGGTTDLIIFYDGIIRHTAVIPLGGNIITKDIKEGCSVMQQQAEKLKTKFGIALAEEVLDNRIITIPGIHQKDYKEISQRNLSMIIQARVEEIFDYVLWEIKKCGYEKKLIGGLVLTGGGSRLQGIDMLAELHTGLRTRIGMPIQKLAHGYPELVANPQFATSIGLLIHGLNTAKGSSVDYKAPQLELVENTRPQRETQATQQQVQQPQSQPVVKQPDAEEQSSKSGFFNWNKKPEAPVSKPAPKAEAPKREPEPPKQKGPGLLDRWVKKTQEWLEASPDSDLE